MEFIVDNIVWFIVGGVVILMTIVGYMAEKTDFASKKYREKVGQEKEKVNYKEEQENIKAPIDAPVQDIVVNDIVSPEIQLGDSTKEEDLYAPLNNAADNIKGINEDLYAPLNNDTDDKNNINEDLYAPLNNDTDNKNNINEDLYSPLNSNQQNEVKDVEEDLYAPLVQNNNIPQNTKLGQEDAPENIIDFETQINDNITNSMEKDTNEIIDQNSIISDNIITSEPEIIVSPVESLNEESGALEMPIKGDIDTLPIVENSDYDKIFPDDPVIINESKGSEGTLTEEKKVDDSNAEDIWKF